MDEEKLSALCLEHLTKIIPGAREKYLGAAVLKTPIAYPVFLNEYETARKDFEQSTGVENLLSIGRNGEFAHIFMEDVYWRTRRKIRNLIETQ
jgi:protoporphyrinogen oxidase